MAWSWRQDSSTPRARAPTPQTCVDVAWRLTNDEVERRGASPTSSEGILSQSSTSSLAHRRRHPRSLQPFVRHWHCQREQTILRPHPPECRDLQWSSRSRLAVDPLAGYVSICATRLEAPRHKSHLHLSNRTG